MRRILFDINGQVDVPNLILQSKSGDNIGNIIGFTELTYKRSLNSANELSLNVHKYLDNTINPLWDEIKDLKIIYIPEFAEKFQIEVSYSDEEIEIKNITGTALCEAELSQIIIRGLEVNTEDDMKYSSASTYQITKFYDELDTKHSLLHRVLSSKANHYNIGHVDDSLCDLAFEFTADGTDIYSFLTGEIAEKCECLFIFDSMTRTINVYDLCSTCQNCYENTIGNMSQKHYRGDFIDVCPNCGSTNIINGYGKDTTILIDKENLANSITRETDIGSLKNCLYVEGGDEIINAAFILSNPNGSQYIYYFSPETLKDMGEPLSTAISEYNKKYDEYKSSHKISAYNIDYYHKYSEAEDKMILSTDKYVNGIEKFDFDYIDEYDRTIAKISNLSTDNNFQKFSNNYNWSYNFTGQNELVKELYNAMDLEDFIQTNMMPEYIYMVNEYDKYTALSLLTNSNFGTLALPSLNSSTTNTIITNVIEQKAKSIIDTSRYKVSVFDGNFDYDEITNTATWEGTFQIVDRLDDDDTTNTINNINYLDIAKNIEKLSSDKIEEIESLNIASKEYLDINDDFISYTKNSIESIISKADLPTSTNICSPTVSYDDFSKEISLYSIDNLKIFYNTIQSCCDVLQSKMDDVADKTSALYNELETLFMAYKNKLAEVNRVIIIQEGYLMSVKKYRALMLAYIKEIAEELNFQLFLENYSTSQNLWEIFNYYRREDTYKNDNIISENLETNAEIVEYAGWLMTYAKKEALKMGTPQYTISTDLNNLLMLPEFEPIIYDFEVGNWIRVRTDIRDDISEELIYKMRLLSYQINFDEIQSIDVEFSNVTRIIDCMSDVKSVLDSAQSIASSYNSVYKEVDKSKETNEIISKWVNESFDLTNQMIKSEGNDQSITIDEHGILARKCDTLTGEYDSHQLKIFSNGLYFTNDNWETIKTGVGKFVYKDPTRNFVETIGYGVIADTIVSNIVCTNELGIYNESGSVKIDGDGIYVYGGELLIGDESSGTYAKITEDGKLTCSGATVIGDIVANSLQLGSSKITELSAVATSGKYDDLSGKPAIPTSVADLGLDASKIIYKGDITQTKEKDSNDIYYIKTSVPTSDGEITYCTYDTEDYIVFGRSKGIDSTGNNYVCISKEGSLTARNAVIYGTIYATDGEFIGKITSSKGNIGGWEITSEGLYSSEYDSEGNVIKSLLLNSHHKALSMTVGTAATYYYPNDIIFSHKESSNSEKRMFRIRGSVEHGGIIMGGETYATNFCIGKHDGDSSFTSWIDLDYERNDINTYKDINIKFGKLNIYSGFNTCATLALDNYGRLACDKEVVATVVGTHLGSVCLPNFWSGNTTYSNRVKMLVSSGGDTARLGVVSDTWLGQGIKWDIYGNLTIDGYSTSSDERLKNSFENLDQFDDVFMNLTPTTFKYNNDTFDKIHFGFKAQNVEDTLNSHGFNADEFFILSKTKKHELSEDYNGYDVELGLSYQEFTAWNTHMIQKCIVENNELKTKIQELCDKIQKLEETA